MQRSVRENIALPFTARLRRWGLIDLGDERKKVDRRVDTLQIDARAAGEVRRLSGGNQQKVTIARWVAGGVRTMLCFDPTRGIDIRTKQPDLRAAPRPRRGRRRGAALHVRAQGDPARLRPRDRHLRRQRRRARSPGVDADEPALLRAAYNLKLGCADARRGGRRARGRGGPDACGASRWR